MSDIVERDIYEVSNQLGGYVGPDTEERLARFLIRESKEAAKLADLITRLRAENEEARDVLGGLAMYLGVGSGDETTTVAQYAKRIRQGIDLQGDGARRLGRAEAARMAESAEIDGKPILYREVIAALIRKASGEDKT